MTKYRKYIIELAKLERKVQAKVKRVKYAMTYVKEDTNVEVLSLKIQ